MVLKNTHWCNFTPQVSIYTNLVSTERQGNLHHRVKIHLPVYVYTCDRVTLHLRPCPHAEATIYTDFGVGTTLTGLECNGIGNFDFGKPYMHGWLYKIRAEKNLTFSSSRNFHKSSPIGNITF